jgi:hypothetical protein
VDTDVVVDSVVVVADVVLGKDVWAGTQGLSTLGLHVDVAEVLAAGTWDCVGAGFGVTPARRLAGLSSSATKPARRTVAATAPRRAALIGRAASRRGCGTSG